MRAQLKTSRDHRPPIRWIAATIRMRNPIRCHVNPKAASMTKRGNGEGTVRRRPNGKWEARYYGSDGRQHSITLPTQSGAIAALRAAHEASAAHLPPPDHTLTVSGWLDEWLDTSVR